MIQTLMKQMSRQLGGGAPPGPGAAAAGPQYNGSADAFDIQSLLGFGDVSRRGYGG